MNTYLISIYLYDAKKASYRERFVYPGQSVEDAMKIIENAIATHDDYFHHAELHAEVPIEPMAELS